MGHEEPCTPLCPWDYRQVLQGPLSTTVLPASSPTRWYSPMGPGLAYLDEAISQLENTVVLIQFGRGIADVLWVKEAWD